MAQNRNQGFRVVEPGMYDFGVADTIVFVLAGGKSSRMGRHKAFLEIEGRTLLSRTIELARALSDQVRIVGDSEKFSTFGPVVEDIYPDRGPLGGIHAALSSSAAELNLMLAVDLPLLRAGLLQFLITQSRQAGAVVTVPRVGGGFQPLCALYRKAFLKPAEAALIEGKNKIDALFSQVATRVIEESELERAGFSAQMFSNVNTPEEYERTVRDLRVQAGLR